MWSHHRLQSCEPQGFWKTKTRRRKVETYSTFGETQPHIMLTNGITWRSDQLVNSIVVRAVSNLLQVSIMLLGAFSSIVLPGNCSRKGGDSDSVWMRPVVVKIHTFKDAHDTRHDTTEWLLKAEHGQIAQLSLVCHLMQLLWFGHTQIHLCWLSPIHHTARAWLILVFTVYKVNTAGQCTYRALLQTCSIQRSTLTRLA